MGAVRVHGGVEQFFCGVTRRRRDRPVPMVHAGSQPGAVVEEMELATEENWVRGAGLLGQIGEHGADRGPEGVGRLFDQPSGWRLGGGGDEGATVEVRLPKLVGLGIEDGQDLPARIIDRTDRLGETRNRAVVA